MDYHKLKETSNHERQYYNIYKYNIFLRHVTIGKTFPFRNIITCIYLQIIDILM